MYLTIEELQQLLQLMGNRTALLPGTTILPEAGQLPDPEELVWVLSDPDESRTRPYYRPLIQVPRSQVGNRRIYLLGDEHG